MPMHTIARHRVLAGDGVQRHPGNPGGFNERAVLMTANLAGGMLAGGAFSSGGGLVVRPPKRDRELSLWDASPT